jgi:hypothetical protein
VFLAALGTAVAPLTAYAANSAAAGPADAGSASGASPATAKAPTSAYFVASNGTVERYGRNVDGVWQPAAPLGAGMTAPPGAPITSAHLSDGSPAAFFVGDDGAIWGGCGSSWRMTAPNLLRPGTQLSVAVTPTVVMLLFSDGQGQWTAMHVESEIHHPCGPPTGGLPGLTTERVPGTWHVPNGAIAAAGLPDGEIGVFEVDATGAVHATWRSPDGDWSDTALTPSGTSLPGGGIASTVSPTGSGLTLFYSDHQGRVDSAQVAEGAGLLSDPEPSPWTVAKIPDGAALAAVGSVLGNDVAYIAVGGTAIDLQADSSGKWEKLVTLSPAGFAKEGRPVAVTAGADEVDVYCGTATGAPGHFLVPPHIGGDVSWKAAGAAGLMPPTGAVTAS